MNKTLLFFVTLLLLSVSGFGQQGPNPSTPVSCKLESLPRDVQTRLKQELDGWNIQQPENLTEHARARWKSEKPLECPGIAVGHFKSENLLSYAILLAQHSRPKGGYKLIVFNPQDDESSYQMEVLEESTDDDASNLFVHQEPVGKFFDERSRKKFDVRASEAILFADVGEKEYETDVYFWARDG